MSDVAEVFTDRPRWHSARILGRWYLADGDMENGGYEWHPVAWVSPRQVWRLLVDRRWARRNF